MAAAYGKNVRVKIGNGASPEVFAAIGGARTDSMTLNNQKIDITNKDSSDWSQYLDQAGVRSMSLSIAGIFLNSSSEALLKTAAINRTLTSFQFAEANGGIWAGKFYVSSYQQSAGYNDAVNYSATLDSGSAITYTPGT